MMMINKVHTHILKKGKHENIMEKKILFPARSNHSYFFGFRHSEAR